MTSRLGTGKSLTILNSVMLLKAAPLITDFDEGDVNNSLKVQFKVKLLCHILYSEKHVFPVVTRKQGDESLGQHHGVSKA